MEAKELRIGNLVKHVHEGSILKVDTINKEAIWVDELPDYHYEMETELIEHIPITEEWLLKFGFDRIKQQNPNLSDTDYPYYFRINEGLTNEMTIEDLNSSVCFVFSYGRCSNIKIEYIHQLQNLYFALTGKELTIK